jgi:predicted ATP-dependent endonuclease of OLD family
MDALRRVTLKGFKSIKAMDLELRPLNVLIGENGAGKSNLVSFLKMLNEKNGIRRFLLQDKARDVFFTTVIDLYGIHAGFPALDEAEKLRHLPD